MLARQLLRVVTMVLAPTLLVTMWPGPITHAANLTFTVTSMADAHDAHPGDGKCASPLPGGPCTLRAAIEEANATASGSVISIILPAGHYLLTGGTLTIAANTVVLGGAGRSRTVIDGGQNTQVFDNLAGATASIEDVAIVNGNAGSKDGGGIANAGTLVLQDSYLSGNTAASGGAIANIGGRAVVLSSTIISNTATSTSTIFPAGTGGGGGIANSATLAISNSTVISNVASSTTAFPLGGGVGNTGNVTIKIARLAITARTWARMVEEKAVAWPPPMAASRRSSILLC